MSRSASIRHQPFGTVATAILLAGCFGTFVVGCTPTTVQVDLPKDGGFPIAVAWADVVGGPGAEVVVQTSQDILIYDRRLNALTRVSYRPSVLPVNLPQDQGRSSAAALWLRPGTGDPPTGWGLVLMDWDGDGKRDLVVSAPFGVDEDVQVYAGTGILIDRVSLPIPNIDRRSRAAQITPSDDPAGMRDRFRSVVPAATRGSSFFFLAYMTDPKTPAGILAWDVDRRETAWHFHLPSDPLALRHAPGGFLVSLGTPVRGEYEHIGRAPLRADGHDAALHYYRITYDGRIVRAQRVIDDTGAIRGTFLTVLPSDTGDEVFFLGRPTLVVSRRDGTVLRSVPLSQTERELGVNLSDLGIGVGPEHELSVTADDTTVAVRDGRVTLRRRR